MSTIPNKFGDNDSPKPEMQGGATNASILAWCMPKIMHARDVRDSKYAQRWTEYTRLWRGFWSNEDKTTDSERSKIIAPALQQAVEMTAAEIEEAIFGRKAWFDITDDIEDDNKDDAVIYRDKLLEDFALDDVPAAVSRTVLLACIYGTGIAKLNVTQKEEKFFHEGKMETAPRVAVTLEPIRPDEFVIDPSALSVDEALFVAHEMIRPIHTIKQKQRQSVYKTAYVDVWQGRKSDTDGTGTKANIEQKDGGVLITEYFGKVPGNMVGESTTDLVEALITIANESVVLRAKKSPFTMQDRPIIAYQHDTVPGEFWGRGVCEKGFNPQKALDSEIRARIDALALISAPMMGADMTRLPRNFDTRVRPGRTIFTRGRPSEVFEPVSFGNPAILAHTFQHSGDLERMVQMGTGAMDSATPVGVNSRNETASGISQMQAGFIKRSKRTMQNLETQFLDILVRRSLWRYMQFDSGRYPVDMKFTVDATMGIMAKEIENTQLTAMLGYLSPEDPARAVVIQAIFENSASASKAELKEAVKQMTAPPSEEEQQHQQQMQQLQLRQATAAVEKEEAIAKKEQAMSQKVVADTKLALAKANHEDIKADLEDDLVDIQAANAVTGAEKARMANNQNKVAEQRNQIELIKANQGGGSSNSDTT